MNNQVTKDIPSTILHAHPNVEVYVDEAAPLILIKSNVVIAFSAQFKMKCRVNTFI